MPPKKKKPPKVRVTVKLRRPKPGGPAAGSFLPTNNYADEAWQVSAGKKPRGK